jgi:hypothetical protein
MNDQQIIEGLTKRVLAAASEAIAAAVEEAYRAGELAARERVLAAIGVTGAAPAVAVAMSSSPGVVRVDDTGRRAPRGLTKEVVTRVLRENPGGLSLEDVQRLALGHDRRLAEKTVYNELMRGRSAEYRHVEGKWHLTASLPNVRVASHPEVEPEVTRSFT